MVDPKGMLAFMEAYLFHVVLVLGVLEKELSFLREV